MKKFALKLFDLLKPIHKFEVSERVLLNHACILHDIGTFIHEQKHNKHSWYLIQKDKMLDDYPENDRTLLSLIVYNHRKKIHKDTLHLSKDERNIVLKLSAILRIADALDFTREKLVLNEMTVSESEISIDLQVPSLDQINEVLSEKKELFVDLFGMEVVLNKPPLPLSTTPDPE